MGMTARARIEEALPIFVANAGLDNVRLFEALVQAGFDRSEASELLEFVPFAFARLILQEMGVELPGEYVRIDRKGRERLRRPVLEEPMYRDATMVGRELATKNNAAFMAIAGRSAEFHAVNALMLAGDRPEDVMLTTPILAWDDEGSRADS